MVRTNQSNPKKIGGDATQQNGQQNGQTTKPPRKKRRYRPGTLALKEIRFYQQHGKLLLPKRPFFRLVKDIANRVGLIDGHNFWQASALEALQVSKLFFK